MNLDWVDVHYAPHEDDEIWYSFDDEQFGLSDEEKIIAHWLISSVSEKEEVIKVLRLISNAEQGIEGAWKSNMHAYFQGNRVTLLTPVTNIDQPYEYNSQLIRKIVEQWGEKMEKFEWFRNEKL